MRKYVITGGPCTGKSSLLQALKDEGFCCVDEVARALIDEAERSYSDCHPARDFPLFQQHVINSQLALEESVKHQPLTFFDRGVPDSIGYHSERGLEIPSYLANLAQTRGYAGVFILDRLSVYKNDPQRLENQEQGARIHDMIDKAYAILPYKLHRVPVFHNDRATSIRMRVEYIKNIVTGGDHGTKPA